MRQEKSPAARAAGLSCLWFHVGHPTANYFLRKQNLVAELSEVFAQLKIPFDGTLGVTAKSGYRSDRRPYQEVFNDEQRKIVEKAFAKEIKLHGYRFGP